MNNNFFGEILKNLVNKSELKSSKKKLIFHIRIMIAEFFLLELKNYKKSSVFFINFRYYYEKNPNPKEDSTFT